MGDMPPKQPSQPGSSSEKPTNVSQEDLKKLIKNVHKHMIKMESRICELLVDEEMKTEYALNLRHEKSRKEFKAKTIAEWKKYQEDLLNIESDKFPDLQAFVAKHDEIWKQFYENFPPRKQLTAEQVAAKKIRMERKLNKITDKIKDIPEVKSNESESGIGIGDNGQKSRM